MLTGLTMQHSRTKNVYRIPAGNWFRLEDINNSAYYEQYKKPRSQLASLLIFTVKHFQLSFLLIIALPVPCIPLHHRQHYALFYHLRSRR